MAVARAIPRFGALMWWLQLGVIQGVTLYGSLLMSVVCDFLCSNTITIVMSLNNRGLSYIRRSLLGWIENLSSPAPAPASFHVQPAADLPFPSSLFLPPRRFRHILDSDPLMRHFWQQKSENLPLGMISKRKVQAKIWNHFTRFHLVFSSWRASPRFYTGVHKNIFLGCVNTPLAAGASSRNLGKAFLRGFTLVYVRKSLSS